MAEGDFDKAAEYASKDTKPVLKVAAAVPGTGEQMKKQCEGAKFKAVDTKIDGDKATVKIETTKDGKTETEDIKLVKEDGEWKVSVQK